MKRIVALSLAVAIAGTSSVAFADAVTKAYSDTSANSTLTVGTLIFKLSKNVYMSYKSDTDNTGYSIGAYHNKGTKTFASSSGDSKIFEATLTAKTLPDAPVGTASADFSSGWSAL